MMECLRKSLFRLLAVAACALMVVACSQLGRQEPAVFGGKFSPSGRYYAYIYQSVFIFSYQRTGGRSVSNGSITHYLQIVDTDTGQKLLAEPFKPIKFDCRYPQVGDVGDSHVVVACSDDQGKPQAPLVFSIASRTVALTGKAIRERNPGLPVDGVHGYDFHRSGQEPKAFFFEGKDGRKYRLDPESGVAQAATGAFVRTDLKADSLLKGRLPDGLREAGDERRFIERKERGHAQRSRDDFLRPRYLILGSGETAPSAAATLHDGGFLVLSNTEKDSGQHKLLALVDAATLATRWSTPLPQSRGDWANRFDEEQVVQQGNQLLLANASQLLRIDLATGKIVSNISLLD